MEIALRGVPACFTCINLVTLHTDILSVLAKVCTLTIEYPCIAMQQDVEDEIKRVDNARYPRQVEDQASTS